MAKSRVAPIWVSAFVDWNSQFHNAGTKSIEDAHKRAEKTLKVVFQAIARTLDAYGANRYRVRVKFYHGWHSGLTATANRRALGDLENKAEFTTPRFDNVIFETPFRYGEELFSALPRRRRKKSPEIHLPDTFRAPLNKGDEPREKMVDTAMVCDILTHARSEPEEWRVVLAEDDDIIPAIFAAEAWTAKQNGKIILIRKKQINQHLLLDDLIKEFHE